MLKPIVVALDGDDDDVSKTIDTIIALGDLVDSYLIYAYLFHPEGYKILKVLMELGKDVIYDLKINHIPTTTQRALRNACKIASKVSIHVSTDAVTMKALVAQTKLTSDDPDLIDVELIGTTILTSRQPKFAFEAKRSMEVVNRVGLGIEAGITKFFCPPLDVNVVLAKYPEAYLICPGIVDDILDAPDHTVFSTPVKTIQMKAKQVVIGRTIMNHEDPVGYVTRVNSEIASLK
jgi:orotidine-5'-phosphate decarboxylase